MPRVFNIQEHFMVRPVCDKHGFVLPKLHRQWSKGGFATLAGILMVGAIGAATATLVLFFGSDFSRSVLSAQQSYEAKALARACADTALLAIHNNISYTGSDSLTLGQGTCEYVITVTGPTSRLIQSSGTVGEVTRNIEISISRLMPTISISSWQDVDEF
ncbi:MAG: hypothetical protein UX57_C0001G0047 [Candidatus Uhrbacteria bacterium GW2011_GWE2_46_68]|uniref:Uncharacterized protein n=2 Tax=Candidatus Uhriibacteriota TaxID=1752732 RepID=A0A0G1SIB4_9BACT|nr:MAG: hypothetical protein UX45_C0002G0048 [Candidatus Uhrbacteria bacterium GW2011_GWF2_46_218]KKU41823.1 MAG: hypothetical protein UX57_C0001G0047 [Candidatus Uhrbacteria bacterium GW2011_GWE2_46_68]